MTPADSSYDRSDSLEAFDALAQMLRHIAAHNPDVVAAAAAGTFQWARWLPADEQANFMQELTETLASTSDTSGESVAVLVREWRATAEVFNDPALYLSLTEPIDTTSSGALVPRPGSGP